MFFSKKTNLKALTLKVLPERGASYAVDENGEPEIVYYRPNSNLFVNRKLDTDVSGFYVNIRRPVIFDVDGLSAFNIPKMPPHCDGFIFINYGFYKSRAYALKDSIKQTWPL